MTSEADALSVALEIARVLEEHEVSYAIGGALAYGVWATPRATLDVDLNVFVTDDRLGFLANALVALGIEVDVVGIRQQSEASGLIVVRWKGLRVGVFTPSIPFSWEAERTRVRLAVGEESFWFLSKEAIAVFKLLFFRPKDLGDLAQLVAIQGAALDTAYVRERIVDMLGEDDVRVERWDRIVASRGTSV